MTRARLEIRLARVGKQRRNAEHDRAIAAHRLHVIVREAANTPGWTKTRIAKVAGISRQTVHDILRKGN